MFQILETIKSYLVSLGWEIDRPSYDHANKALDTFDHGIQALAGNAVKYLGKAAISIAAFGVATAGATAKFLNGLGNQEIQMEILARQLWTTQEQAMAFNATLKAMGANLQDLYLSPTLMSQYEQLHGVALEMTTPGDYNSQIQKVQDIQLQFKQMKLEVAYAMQWVGYYLVKDLSGPLGNIQGSLQKMNAWIVKHLPDWTKRVATWVASFIQAGIYIGDALKSAWNGLQKLWTYLPGWGKGVVAALAVVGTALLTGPFGIFILTLTTIILLLDDFYTYLHGGKSALGPFWSNIQTVFQQLTKWFKNMMDTLNKNGDFTAFADAFQNLSDAVSSLVKTLTDSKSMNALQGFGNLVTQMFGDIINQVTASINGIASFVTIINDLLKRNWGQAAKDVANSKNLLNLAATGFLGPAGILTYGVNSDISHLLPKASNTTNNSSQNITNNYTISPGAVQTTINGSASPSAVTNSISGGLNKIMHNIRPVY